MRPPSVFLAVLVPVALVVGVWLGGHPDTLPGFARDSLVADPDGRQYEQALDTIQRDYYRKVDRQQLLNKSIGAAVDSLDDQFSHYFSPREYTDFQLDTEGRFEGVGMTVSAAKQGLRVAEGYKGSPAAKGGLKSGDLIVRVNGRSLAGKTSDQATTLIKGPEGTSVTLGVRTGGGKERELKLK